VNDLARRSVLVTSTVFAPHVLRAQSWPTQSIRLIVPYAPGGTTDLMARLVSQPLSERLGVAVTIDNRPGAGATVGSLAVAQAVPDGHTLLMSNIASHGIGPTLYPNIRYDAVRDFSHIALITENPSVFVANPRAGVANLADLAARHRASPGGLDMASSGAGSSNHLLIVLMGRALGRDINHIPFRGAGPAMTAVIAGQVPLMSDSLPSAAAHLRAGTVRGVAMSSAQRHPAFPAIPTFREQGHDIVGTGWFGLSGPAGMPPAVVEQINREVRAILATPEQMARFAELGGTPGRLSAGEYTDYVRREVEYWAPVVRASGAQPD
jgi:tripartite-type tricarboxylate transporter receptor subunit TctC